MNTYKITVTRENGTQFSDNFTDRTEAAARKSFKECYRHDNYTIVSVELVRTDAQATKQQERETLEKIKKMVEELGSDSYLSIAFTGCFEDAEENIENDFALSMNGRWQYAEQEVERLKARVAELEDKLSESEKDYEAAHAAAHEIADQKDAEIAKLKARLDELLADQRTGSDYITEQAASLRETKRRAEAAEAEVIALKAKLYDYIVAERGGAQE